MRAEQRRRRPARQAGDLERVELVACLGNEPSLDAIRRPGERHADAALFRSAAATASDGRTCPAVPPAAIRARNSLGCSVIRGDVKEDPHGREQYDEARPAVGDERERDPGQRGDAEHGREVDGRLTADERRDPGGEQLPERVAAAQRDREAGERERGEGGDHGCRPDQPELLADHREDHVRLLLGEVVDLLDALAEALARDAAGADPDQRLDGLEAGVLRVGPRIEEAEERARAGTARSRSRRDRPGSRSWSAAASVRPGTPATTSIPPIISSSAIVVPRSGSTTIRAAKRQVTMPTGFQSSPSVRGAPLRARYAAAQMSSASFASSDGWNVSGPAVSQRLAPLISRRDDEHRQAEPERGQQERRREVPQPPVVEAGRGERSARRRSSA